MSNNPERPFSRHHALITGGGRGIGAAVAEALARQGANLSLLGRSADVLQSTAARLREKYGVQVATASADVASEEAVRRAIGTVRDVLGNPTILVNNAGIAISSPFLKADSAFWRKLLDVDLMGPVYCTQAVLPAMLEAKWGRIVNIGSTAGVSGFAYITTYCAAKHALHGLTRALAMEVVRQGITVNAVCPGYVDTEMTAGSVANIVKKTQLSREDAIANLVSHNPQGRLIQPEEVADAVVWLCGDGAGAVTGQCILVAGGELMP